MAPGNYVTWDALILFLFKFISAGIAQFVSKFAEPGDPEYAPPVKEAETSVGYLTSVFTLN